MNRNIAQKHTRCLLLVTIFAIICVIAVSTIKKNIHEVIPGQVYRSAQVSPGTIKAMHYFKKIRSIINLRGKNPQQKWYRDEIKTATALKIAHYDLALSSTHFPDHDKLRQLVALIEHAPKPVLLHCEGGSDRAGMGSAIALTLMTNLPLETIRQQLSWRYLVTSSNSSGKKVFNAYQQWLQKQHTTTSKNHFLEWVDTI